MARALRRDHDHVVARRRVDAAVVDVEAVREEHGGARREVRLDVLLEDLRLHLVGQRGSRRAARPCTASATVLTVRPASSAFAHEALPVAQPDLDLDARVAQVQRVGVALAAVADARRPCR